MTSTTRCSAWNCSRPRHRLQRGRRRGADPASPAVHPGVHRGARGVPQRGSGLAPPDTATYRNPYRQWIGALIRADIFGCVCPGDPWRAAELAQRNARFSHTGNGVYAAMWAAGLIASCLVAEDTSDALSWSMSCIPPSSQLTDALHFVAERHAAGNSWDDAIDEIQARLGHLSWVHAVSNAAIITAGLLWGESDFARTVGLTVQAGWDTDSNGATAGSAFGAMHGAQALPAHMIDPSRTGLAAALLRSTARRSPSSPTARFGSRMTWAESTVCRGNSRALVQMWANKRWGPARGGLIGRGDPAHGTRIVASHESPRTGGRSG